MTFEDETAKSASNALRELLNGAICGGHCGDEDECSHYDATDRALSALSEAGYTVVKTEDVRWQYGVADSDGGVQGRWRSRSYAEADLLDCGPERVANEGLRIVRRRIIAEQHGPWEPVPESDTLGGGLDG